MGQKGTWGVSYDRLGALALEGLKELKVLFDTDHADLIKLKTSNDALVSRTTALEAQLKAANDNETRLERRLDALERSMRAR